MIELRNVVKYHHRELVLDNVSLTVDVGTQMGILGPGGAGKSLIAKMVCGLVKPDSGEVFVDGENLIGMSPVELNQTRRKIGMLFQNYALFDFMNVEENIAFPLRQENPDMPDEDVKKRVADLLELVSLPGIQHNFQGELSGGMKKRVTWARAVINNPPILIYDDPTAGLDPVTSSRIFIFLEKQKREFNTTSIVISHDVMGIRDICEKFVLMNKGKKVFEGSRKEIEESDIKLVRQFWDGDSDG